MAARLDTLACATEVLVRAHNLVTVPVTDRVHDYSSAMVDFASTGKPMAFYTL